MAGVEPGVQGRSDAGHSHSVEIIKEVAALGYDPVPWKPDVPCAGSFERVDQCPGRGTFISGQWVEDGEAG
ncbi:hypothetical protein [Actinoallomurus sp. CA-142502]|uniref:hypothetical protein n=1 Tax=Actinoallomurus sp. CA-142502 TaxID=3239885 RepID=UPI003D8D747A